MLAVVLGFYVCHEELNSNLMLMWHVLIGHAISLHL